MAKSNDNYLTGKCLVSMPSMEDERFAGSLIYICSHTKDGAFGFVVNKRLEEVTFSDLAKELSIDKIKPINNFSIHHGGPLEKIRGFVLHSTDYVKNDTVVISKDIAVSSSLDILTDIASGKGPKDNLIALGYASWAPKQLEQEIISGIWLVADTSSDLMFKTKDEEKWQKAIEELGIDLSRISSQTGHA